MAIRLEGEVTDHWCVVGDRNAGRARGAGSEENRGRVRKAGVLGRRVRDACGDGVGGVRCSGWRPSPVGSLEYSDPYSGGVGGLE